MAVVEGSGLPVVAVAAGMREPNALGKLLGRGRRASTIRRRVLDWHKFARFLRLTFNSSWPESLSQVLDYISTLADGGAPRSTITRAINGDEGGMLDTHMGAQVRRPAR